MPEVTQKFGFDASAAIAEIKQLNSALGTLTTGLNNVATAGGKTGKNRSTKRLGELSAIAQKAGVTLDKFGKKGANSLNKVDKSLKNANKSAKSFILSAETLGRIAIAQVIVRGLNLITTKFKEGITAAAEFNQTLAETAAISPRGLGDFSGEIERLSGELLAVSDNLGLDVLDLAQAKYQEFSNQVKGAADSTALFDNATRLAVITGTSAEQAVNALSSALNSYGEGVEGAERASATLFKTVELGRIRLSEIADQIGNVTPLARSAGISFIEIGASLATLTKNGISASRGLTQIRGLINQLQKPSKELQRVFEEVFEVQNVQQAIQKFGGLQPLLLALQVEADKTADGFTKLFGNIRARNAITGLTQNSDDLSSALKEMGAASTEAGTFLSELLTKFKAQEGQQFKESVEQLNNAFIRLGTDALPATIKLLNLFTAVVENVGIGVAALATGGFAILTFRLLQTASAIGLTKVGLVGLGIASVGAALSLGLFIKQLIIAADTAATLSRIEEGFDKIDAASAKALKTIQEEATAARKELLQLAAVGDVAMAKLAASAFTAQAAIRRAEETFISNIDTSLDSIVSGREKVLKKLEKNIAGFENRSTKRTEESSKIRQKIQDTEFERRLRRFNEIQQAAKRQQRAETALRKADRTDDTSTVDGLNERLDLLKQAEKLALESVKAAEVSKNRGQELRASKLVNTIRRKELGTITAIDKLDEERAAKSKAALGAEKARIDQLKKATKEFRSLLSSFDETTGAPKTKDQVKESNKQLEIQRKLIQDLALAGTDLTTGDILGIAGLGDDIAKDLEGLRPKFTGVTASIREALIAGAKGLTLDVNLNVKAIIEQAGKLDIPDLPDFNAANAVANLQETRKLIQERVLKLTDDTEKFEGAMVGVGNAADKAQSIMTQLADDFVRPLSGGVPFFSGLNELDPQQLKGFLTPMTELVAAFDDISNKAQISDQDIQKFSESLDEARQKGVDFQGLTESGEQVTGTRLLELLREQQTAQKEAAKAGGEGVTKQLDTAKTLLQTTDQQLQTLAKLSEAQEIVTSSTDETAGSQKALNLLFGAGTTAVSGEAKAQGQVTTAINLSTTAQKRLNAERAKGGGGGGGDAASKMFGGPMYRAFGGFVPRGSDTIPAMLSPGETVINARSSRRFASQIASMNAGTPPVYRANGGVVNNNSVNVGDINVNGAANPDATARRVAQELRREFRRGTSSRP